MQSATCVILLNFLLFAHTTLNCCIVYFLHLVSRTMRVVCIHATCLVRVGIVLIHVQKRTSSDQGRTSAQYKSYMREAGPSCEKEKYVDCTRW